MTKPATSKVRRGAEARGQLLALSVATGSVTQAAKQLGIPQSTASDWWREADSSELRNFASAKALEAAAVIFEGLPELMGLAHKRIKAALEDTGGNGTQAQAAVTALAVHIDKGFRLLNGSAIGGRYGSDGGSSGPTYDNLPPLE